MGEVAGGLPNDSPAPLQSVLGQAPSKPTLVSAHSGAATGWTPRRQAGSHQQEAGAQDSGGELQLRGNLSFPGHFVHFLKRLALMSTQVGPGALSKPSTLATCCLGDCVLHIPDLRDSYGPVTRNLPG